jgi:hypothetical protein
MLDKAAARDLGELATLVANLAPPFARLDCTSAL